MTVFPPMTVGRSELLVDGSDDAFRSLVDDMTVFAARLQHIREALARRMGVSPPQYVILMALARRPLDTAFGVKDLAERLRMSVPFVVNETKKLATMGLLAKETVADDRRRIDLILTAAGMTAVRTVAPIQRAVNDALFSSLNEGSLRTLTRLTNDLLASCDRANELASARDGTDRIGDRLRTTP